MNREGNQRDKQKASDDAGEGRISGCQERRTFVHL